MPSLSAGIAAHNTAFLSTSQQNRLSPYLPNGEPRPGNEEVSEKAAAYRKARLEQFDREVAEAKERREREKEEKEMKKSHHKKEQEGDDASEKEKAGFRQSLKDKIAGWRE
ncbi:hypothetical protein DIS24_g6632 [Lasiodiplodia hormozganensis]|uniref:Uncharacterized protein n=1 Tax=Lasiodiplodia hormozganensis TaxID=869390 RepID=A0AA40CVE0_9PEZI|nr:uncharacterized protein LTHEOB_9620 [Lasiodiplodia theobromae]KAF4540146.1 hypothetical protein LTHEOB_9620 [Lasiodiplodia theobromae]KAK0650629.1 hypothetical protein DIS24_g6632 [Lasiodiplodia hormozganensis]